MPHDSEQTSPAREADPGSAALPLGAPSHYRGRAVTGPLRVAGRQLLRSDVALLYTVAVLGVFGWVRLGGHSGLIAEASTNLDNLQNHPSKVLFLSAFVVSEPAELLLLPVLTVAYSVAQLQLGRMATIVSIVIGHALATLSVATLVVSGIFHGLLQASIASATDVGFSYGLACVTGVLVTRLAFRERIVYVTALVAIWSWAVVLGPPFFRITFPTFTDVGHTLALLTGFGLSTMASAGRRSNVRGRPPSAVDTFDGPGADPVQL